MRYSILSNNSPSPLDIYSIGCSNDINVTRFGPGRRNVYIIHYVSEGQGYYNGNKVMAGQGFLIRPGDYEEYICDLSNPWDFLWVISSDNRIEEIFKRYNADSKTCIFNYNSINYIKQVEKEIIRKNDSVLDSLKVLEMFLGVINSHLSEREENKNNSDIYIDFCLNFIRENLYKEIKVGELTRLLGVSQPYLYNIFLHKLGISPKQYIISEKLKYAKKLLKETDMTVEEVANSVGYNDGMEFSKIFKKKEGASPKKFKCSKYEKNFHNSV